MLKLALGYGTIGKGREERPAIGMTSMMDEMQKTLARRRAKVDKADEVLDLTYFNFQ